MCYLTEFPCIILFCLVQFSLSRGNYLIKTARFVALRFLNIDQLLHYLPVNGQY
uniref:Uncharacterized protein n=1 Tax=Rhizophora mucronata TaxID=61149 RepID=A0A2P2QBX9_RHIMU